MMRMPSLATIEAAERRVVQSRLITRDRLYRVRVAYRAALARPSTLVLVMATAGVAGFWLTRRRRATASSAGARIATASSVAGVVGAFIVQYGMRHLPFFLQQVWAAQQARVARAAPELSETAGLD